MAVNAKEGTGPLRCGWCAGKGWVLGPGKLRGQPARHRCHHCKGRPLGKARAAAPCPDEMAALARMADDGCPLVRED